MKITIIIYSLLFNIITSFQINQINNLINNGVSLSYSKLLNNIENHKISKIIFTKTLSTVVSENEDLDNYVTDINPYAVTQLLDISKQNNVETIFSQESSSNIFDLFVPLIFLSFILTFIRSLFIQYNSGMPLMSNNLNKDKINMIKANISLNSFSGSPEILQECVEVVSYLKNSSLYEIAGAEIPKGILLEGPPGTGKTLLAKAIASETNSNFISISGSEFVEIFVGMGANKVRNLFHTARKNKPCIIFIDEIDAVGKQRGLGLTFGNDEREQTLNQILTEMDGFSNNDKILIIAATNRKEVLDQALLRPGRFDRIIKIPLPDFNSRKSILNYHSKNKLLNETINMNLLSELTTGFSGAQLKNLLNEAAIFAAREGNKIISEKNIYDSLDKLIVGIIKTIDTRDEETQRRVAIHEAGHALLVKLYKYDFELKKVSIKNTYNGAGGYTIFNENKNISESGLYTKDLLTKRIIISMGGKAAEKVIYGDNLVSNGAIQDIKVSYNLANQMITEFGMGNLIVSSDMKSEYAKKLIDLSTLNLIDNAFNDAVDLIKNHTKILNKIVDELMINKVLLDNDIEIIINNFYNELK
jgi:cell division protease FtsH